MAVVIITAAKEEVRRWIIKSDKVRVRRRTGRMVGSTNSGLYHRMPIMTQLTDLIGFSKPNKVVLMPKLRPFN